MNTVPLDPQAALRKTVYALLIALCAGVMLGRIMAVDSVDRLSQEKIRFDKIPADRAGLEKLLQAKGLPAAEIQAELDRKEAEWRAKAPIRRPFLSGNDRSRWATVRALVEPTMRVEGFPYAIDKVVDQPNWDTIDMAYHDGHYFSSKPPLMATLLAIPYWIVYRTTGATLGSHPYAVGRGLLVLVNLLPLVLSLVLLSRLVERLGRTDFSRVFTIAAAAFGTLLTTFAVVLNNHLIAAVSAIAAIYFALPVWFDGDRRLSRLGLAGLLAAFTVTEELPALALFAALTLALLWRAPRETLKAYLPAAALVAAAFFGTNWIAHQSLRPPYMHRGEGDNWYAYEFKGRPSYWQDPKGIDRGEKSQAVYALHALVGHHGIFSLTPIWLLSAAGLVFWAAERDGRRLWRLALLIGGVSVVCLVFYILLRPQLDRNYGGTSAGFRWAFWFAPLWLLAMLPTLDRMAGRPWLRGLALALLILSVFSASYPTWNPWTHPWLLQWMQHMGWVTL